MFEIKPIQGFISDFSQSGKFLSTYGRPIDEDWLSEDKDTPLKLPTAAF